MKFSVSLLLATFVLALVHPCATASAITGKSAKKSADGWIVVPTNYIVSWMMVAPGTEQKWRRTIVDVPPSASIKSCRPKVTQSCGDPDIDEIAVKYVKHVLEVEKEMAKKLENHTLAFPLEIRPLIAKLVPEKPRPADSRPGSILTPAPAYPEYSRQRRDRGIGQYRITFGPKGGRPTEVVTMKSAGDKILDANVMLFILNYWNAPNPPPKQVLVKEVEYRLLPRML